MNNYEEEYFEDENDLDEDDFWNDTPEFDEQIEEFKTTLRADVKREIKGLIERLQTDRYEDSLIEGCLWCMLGRGDGVMPWQYCDDGKRRESEDE